MQWNKAIYHNEKQTFYKSLVIKLSNIISLITFPFLSSPFTLKYHCESKAVDKNSQPDVFACTNEQSETKERKMGDAIHKRAIVVKETINLKWKVISLGFFLHFPHFLAWQQTLIYFSWIIYHMQWIFITWHPTDFSLSFARLLSSSPLFS